MATNVRRWKLSILPVLLKRLSKCHCFLVRSDKAPETKQGNLGEAIKWAGQLNPTLGDTYCTSFGSQETGWGRKELLILMQQPLWYECIPCKSPASSPLPGPEWREDQPSRLKSRSENDRTFKGDRHEAQGITTLCPLSFSRGRAFAVGCITLGK